MLRWGLVFVLSGCVIELPPPGPGWPEGDAHFQVDPNDHFAGERALLEITDAERRFPFHQVWDVEALGDFDVVDWTSRRDTIEIVADFHETASGAQILSLEVFDGNSGFVEIWVNGR